MAAAHLSGRILRACSLVTEGRRIVDIGTDHAYLPIELCRSGRIPSAIAADVRPGPLARAKAHVHEAHLEDRIECRLSDGFSRILPGEVSSAVITGMGGLLIIDILRKGEPVVASLDELVLGPQSELENVRISASELGFVIDQEEMLEEEGKFYVLLHLQRDSGAAAYWRERWKDHPEEARFGPCLLSKKDPVLARYLKRQQKVCCGLLQHLEKKRMQDGLSASAKERYSEIKEELRLIVTAQKTYD